MYKTKIAQFLSIGSAIRKKKYNPEREPNQQNFGAHFVKKLSQWNLGHMTTMTTLVNSAPKVRWLYSLSGFTFLASWTGPVSYRNLN